MPETCEALVSTGPWQAERRRLALPADLAGGGLGRVLAAGMCGSDVPIASGASRGDIFPLVTEYR